MLDTENIRVSTVNAMFACFGNDVFICDLLLLIIILLLCTIYVNTCCIVSYLTSVRIVIIYLLCYKIYMHMSSERSYKKSANGTYDMFKPHKSKSQIDLDLPPDIYVSSRSEIKLATVAAVLRMMNPANDFEITGFKVPSEVPEQPIGSQTIAGALNRLRNVMSMTKEVAKPAAIVSIENGLFRVSRDHTPASGFVNLDGASICLNGADLTPDFDPNAEYEDRVVVAISLPVHPTIVQISANNEAVKFPSAAVHAAHNAAGGFEKNTAGSKLFEMGLVTEKQDPHIDLTAGSLSRQKQMARVIIRALTILNHDNT